MSKPVLGKGFMPLFGRDAHVRHTRAETTRTEAQRQRDAQPALWRPVRELAKADGLTQGAIRAQILGGSRAGVKVGDRWWAEPSWLMIRNAQGAHVSVAVNGS